MRVSHFLLVMVATFVACFSTIATAEEPVQIESLTTDPHRQIVNEDHRYLRGSKTIAHTNAEHEERVTTPQFGQYWGLFKLPKFKNLPLAKQLNQVRLFFGKHAGKAYIAFWNRFHGKS